MGVPLIGPSIGGAVTKPAEDQHQSGSDGKRRKAVRVSVLSVSEYCGLRSVTVSVIVPNIPSTTLNIGDAIKCFWYFVTAERLRY